MKKNCIVWLCLAAAIVLPASEIVLAEKGRTRYSILIPEKPQDATRLAARTLQEVLKTQTGAEFPVVSTPAKDGKYIVLEKAPGKKLFSGTKQMADLKEDEYVFCSRDGNIYLYGEGIHGAFNAAVDFMEDQLGWRWFSAYDKPVIPKRETLKLQAFETVRRFQFPYRMRMYGNFVFFHGCNMMTEERNQFCKARYGRYMFDPLIRSKKFWPVFVHTNYLYIPPFKVSPQALKGDFRESWLPVWEYAKSHPEYFAMDAKGSRKPFIHLCWSNQELRKTYRAVLEKQIAVSGENCIIAIDNGDDAACGVLCYCPGCVKLVKKYRSLAGPSFDFALETARLYQKTHPGVLIVTPVVRRNPAKGNRYEAVDPGREPVPANLIGNVCNKEFINRPIDHPDCRNFFEILKTAWKRVGKLYLWSYPHPFQLTDFVPFSNLHIQVENLKKVQPYVAIHFDEVNESKRLSFCDLELYVILHLIKNPDADVEKMIKEFTEGRFGKAGKLVRTYQKELEDACSAWKYGINYDYGVHDFDMALGYLTPERLLRWEKMFDQMLSLVKNDQEKTRAVRYLRISLDYAVVSTWLRCKKLDPVYLKDPKFFADRMLEAAETLRPHPANARMRKHIKDVLFILSMSSEVKPLPAPFDKVPSSDIIRTMPINTWYTHGRKMPIPGIVKDKDAAYGFAYTVHRPDLPFQMGIHHFAIKKDGPRLMLEEDDLVLGRYHIYKLGDTHITQKSMFWFSARSWATNLEMGRYWDSNNTTQMWTAYASLKFPENYEGKETDIVLCDQIFFVKKK